MKVLPLFGVGSAILISLTGCNDRPGDTWPFPENEQVVSALRRTPQENLLVAVTYSGGAAGDTTYRVLACKSGAERCELLASVDTNDGLAPQLSKTQNGIALMVNKGDYVADFRNFGRELASLQPGELYLRYREDASAK